MTCAPEHSTAAFVAALEQRIASRHVLTHPFYQAWNRGELSREALQDYAAQYYHHVAAFPCYLSALHSHTPDAGARRVLLQNLVDEEAGTPNHPDLWLQFAEGVGVTPEAARATPAQPETEALIATFYRLCQNGPFTDGVAALYAYESQIPEVAETKIAGLRAHYGVTETAALRYFDVHREADVVHRAQERALLEAHVTDVDQADSALQAADQALEAGWNLLSGVCDRHGIVQ